MRCSGNGLSTIVIKHFLISSSSSSISIVIIAAVPVHCPTDIVFVLDGSGSIGSTNFELVKSFLSQLVGRLDIDSGNTRVGLVVYSSGVSFTFNLNRYTTVSSVQAAISALRYRGGGTNTADALAYVRTTMLTLAAGDRGDVPNVVAVITDGRSNTPSATQVFFADMQSSCLRKLA